MKLITFIILVSLSSSLFANEKQCTFISDNTYWKETVSKCLGSCVFKFDHTIKIYLNGENNIGATKGSSKTDFAIESKKFKDYQVKDDYYDLYKGEKIDNGIYEVCAIKKSNSYKNNKNRLESEEEFKNNLKSIPNFFKELLIGSLLSL
jgi:hypothetical protein